MPTVCHSKAIGEGRRESSRKLLQPVSILREKFLGFVSLTCHRRKETTKLRSARISNSRLWPFH